MDIKFVAKTLIDAGWAVVPIVKGEKRASSSWQKKTYTPKHFNPDDGIAGKCGKPSEWRVDFDCDALEAVKAARLLLPSTGLIHGRPGKPTSHYWFIIEGMKTTQFTDVKDSSGQTQMLVEIRSSGGYTVLPPSIHPSGDVIAWELERDPMRLSSEEGYAYGRNVALSALLARHYPGSGARHFTIGQYLPGFLLQGGLDDLMMLHVIKAAAEIAGDSDWEDREKAIRATIDRFKAGDLVTGGPKLAEAVGENVVAKMRGWLKMADVDSLEVMNQKHFFTRMGVKSVIGREDDPSGVIFQPVRELYPEYANQFIQTGLNKEGDPAFAPLFETWLKSKNRRSFSRVVFCPPPLKASEDEFNLWNGFSIEPAPGDCSAFLEHMHEIICAGNDEYYKYLTQYCALICQQPGLPAGVSVVMRGEQGTGKGTFVRMFERIFGTRHFAHLDRSEELVKWNSLVSGKVVVFADEAFFAGDKENTGALKRIITEPTIRIARKHIDATEEPNCIHLFMATNEEWAIPAGIGERRFFALDVSTKNQQSAFFDRIYDDANQIKEEIAKAFLYEMLQVPTSLEVVRRLPRTTELRHQQNQSLPLHLKWVQECLYEGLIGQIQWTNDWVPVASVYDCYKSWVREHTNRFLDKLEFGRQTQKYFTKGKPSSKRINGDAQRCIELMELTEARDLFDLKLKTQNEWPEAPGASGVIPF